MSVETWPFWKTVLARGRVTMVGLSIPGIEESWNRRLPGRSSMCIVASSADKAGSMSSDVPPRTAIPLPDGSDWRVGAIASTTPNRTLMSALPGPAMEDAGNMTLSNLDMTSLSSNKRWYSFDAKMTAALPVPRLSRETSRVSPSLSLRRRALLSVGHGQVLFEGFSRGFLNSVN